MKVKRYQADDERAILTGMIVSDRVLGRIFAHLRSEKKPFRSKWCNRIGRWCLAYFEKYEAAPGSNIVTLFRDFAERSKDEAEVEIVEKFLSTLSDDHKAASKELNEDHLVDVAAKFFNQVKIEGLVQSLESDLATREVESAQKRLAKFTPFNLATTDMVGVFDDEESWRGALDQDEGDVLIRYPKALGEFFGSHLTRDGFIAFLAPEKRGKSFWLIDLAWRAATINRRRTLLYSVGDMSQKQMMRRLIVRAAQRPLAKGFVERPDTIEKQKGGEIVVVNSPRNFESSISFAQVKSAMEKIRMRTSSEKSLLQLRCTSNSTTKVSDIAQDIEELERQGWVTDVVVIDYADILASESGSEEEHRHQIDATWKALRRLSQDRHILVVTATQSNAASYDSKTMTRRHFSEDKRKLAHVTGMIGINQSEEEKRRGLYRLNWIALREGAYYESRCVTVAGSLALSNPAIVSIW